MFGSFGSVARLAAFAFAMLAGGAHAEGMPPVSQPVEAYPDASGAAALKIRNVIHQTFIDLDEQGTEAAAATAVGIEMTAARRELVPPFVFRADKPFLFILRDRRTNLILFMGRYVSAG